MSEPSPELPAGLANGTRPTHVALEHMAAGLTQLAQQLGGQGQMLFQMLSSLQRPMTYCAVCSERRRQWEGRNTDALQAAQASYALLQPGDRPDGFTIIDHIRQEIAEPLPDLLPGITTVAGTLYCPGDMPPIAIPGTPGKPMLLQAHGALSQAMIAQLRQP